jgi:hypothetical protein
MKNLEKKCKRDFLTISGNEKVYVCQMPIEFVKKKGCKTTESKFGTICPYNEKENSETKQTYSGFFNKIKILYEKIRR